VAGDVILISVLLASLAGLRYPFFGLCLYIWFDLTAPQFAFYNHLDSIPASLIIGMMALVGLFIGYRGKISITPIVTLLFLYVLWFCLTTFNASASEALTFKFNRSVKVFIPLILCCALINSQRRVEMILWLFVLGISVFGFRGGLATLAGGGGYGTSITGSAGTVLSDSSTFSIALVMTVPLLVYLKSHSILFPEIKKYGWIVNIVIALNLVAVVGSFARAGLVSAAVYGLLLIFFEKHKFRNLVLVSLTVALGAIFAPSAWFERMGSIQTYEGDASALGRIFAWKFAINTANDNIFGLGFGAFTKNYFEFADRHVESHSWFFEALGEHGYIGCGLVSGIFLISIFTCLRIMGKSILKETVPWAPPLAKALILGFAPLVVGGLFVGIASHAFTYFVPLACSGLYAALKLAESKSLTNVRMTSKLKKTAF
jgi:putative inorganic carbon (hco3(-)) transporter